jgi:hypothetical protein
MKKFLLLFVLFACSNKEKIETPPSPTVVDEKAKKIVYEGVIKTSYGEGPVTLALQEVETGLTSRFELDGEVAKDMLFGRAVGEYSTLSGAEGNEVILQLHGSFMYMGRAQKAKKGTVAFKPEIQKVDLFFVTEGGNKLVLVDEDFDRIADDNRFTLYKRSRLFTAEGYITFEDNRTDFYEQNTNERWDVATLGAYRDAQKIYDSLVSQKFEGMYLKALAYSVESDSSDKELIVIKKILEMKKSDAYTNKDRAAGLGYN